MEITFKTQKGSEIFINNELELYVNGAQQFGGALNVVLNDHGKCLKQNFGRIIIPIPSLLVNDIETLINTRKKEVSEQLQLSIEAEKDYLEHRNAVYKMADVGFV